MKKEDFYPKDRKRKATAFKYYTFMTFWLLPKNF